MEIRRGRPGDRDALVAFNLAMAHETEGRELDRETVNSGVAAVFQSEDRGFYLVATSPGGPDSRMSKIIGGLLITYEWSDWRNGVIWWIQSVYVEPGWRRRGVYRRLYETVKADALERGDVAGIRLYVERDNAVAHSVYGTLGMELARYDMYEDDFIL
jgi:GNAT superfamily N-acetyltransferase